MRRAWLLCGVLAFNASADCRLAAPDAVGVYQGACLDGLAHGQGRFQWTGESAQRGNVYVGAFRHGRRHGQGVLVTAAGDRYAGPWTDDVRAGPSAGEIQFQRRYQALSAALQPGTRVCRVQPYGIGGHRLLRGRVNARNGGQLDVHLDAPPPELTPSGGVLANERLFDWRPCL